MVYLLLWCTNYFGVPTTQVRVAGFSQYGREWIANGMVSTFIAFITSIES